MALRIRLVPDKMMSYAKHPLGHRGPAGFADLFGNSQAPFRDGAGGAKITNSDKKDIKPREQVQLIWPVLQRIGQIEATLNRNSDFVAISTRVHGGDCQRLLERQFAFRPAINLR